MLRHQDGQFDHVVEQGIAAEEEVPYNQTPFGLYTAVVQPVEIAIDPYTQEQAAEALKNWFLRHHPQEAQRLGHVPYDTWDRMARNRKRGYNDFLEVMGQTFQRADAKHARSRALPDMTADSFNVKWSALLSWTRGTYTDNNSCFFTGNRVYLNGMVNKGTTMLGFHDMEQGVGTGRVFVSPTWQHEDVNGYPINTPNGLLLWGGYGQLDDLGWMPVKPAVDVLQKITHLPYRTDLRDNVVWLGHSEPSQDEREAIRALPNNYNAFPQEDEPAAFDCKVCEQHFPAMSSRIIVTKTIDWDEDKYNAARAKEVALNEQLQQLAHSDKRFTPTGRQSVPWAREYQRITVEANEANKERRLAGDYQIIEEHTCMECHFAKILPRR